MNSGSGAKAAEARSVAEVMTERVLAAVHDAWSAMEAEAVAMQHVEEAYRTVNQASAEVRRATEDEQMARPELPQARNRARLAIAVVKNASEIRAKAAKEADRRDDRMRAELARGAEAEKRGRRPDVAASDAARRKAGEAQQKASVARVEAEKAREASAAADGEFKAAQERAAQALARIRSGKAARAAAIGRVAHTEDDARKAMATAQKALAAQAAAKKAMDQTIKSLGAMMLGEARAAEAAERAAATSERRRTGLETGFWKSAERLVGRLKAIVPLGPLKNKVRGAATANVGTGPGSEEAKGDTAKRQGDEIGRERTGDSPDADVCSGVLRVLIVGPTDLSRVRGVQERLEQARCRVKLVGGSTDGGTKLTIDAEQPVPLVSQLRELEFVEWVSKRGSEIEVTFKPFGEPSARAATTVPPAEVGSGSSDRPEHPFGEADR